MGLLGDLIPVSFMSRLHGSRRPAEGAPGVSGVGDSEKGGLAPWRPLNGAGFRRRGDGGLYGC